MLPVIKDTLQKLKIKESYIPDSIILLQPTSPLRTADHIDASIKTFYQHKCESMVSVCEIPHNMSPFSAMKIDKNGFLTPYLKLNEQKHIRHKNPVFFARNGAAIYIVSYKTLIFKNSLFGKKIFPYFMSKKNSVDIDDLLDFKIAEMLMKERIQKNETQTF